MSCCLCNLCLESLQNLAQVSHPHYYGHVGMAVGKEPVQSSDLQELRAGYKCVLGNDKCREVIAAVCSFGVLTGAGFNRMQHLSPT